MVDRAVEVASADVGLVGEERLATKGVESFAVVERSPAEVVALGDQLSEVLAFLANSALFLGIGLEFSIADLRGRTLVATIVAVLAMLAGQAGDRCHRRARRHRQS